MVPTEPGGSDSAEIKPNDAKDTMAPLTTQFNQAKSNVEPSKEDKDKAPTCHEEVRDALGQDSYLQTLGIRSALIGSYRRNVSIRRVKDVDVFCKLDAFHDVESDLGALALLNRFETALQDQLGEDRVARQARSFQVSFDETDMFVDVVPARPCGDHWEIPGRDGDWEETNPEKLKTLTEDMNEEHPDKYVPTVKLVRQIRKAHLGKQPGGLFFEILTYHAFKSGLVSGANTAEYLCTTLERLPAELQLANELGLADPTIEGSAIATRATERQLATALSKFSDLALEARAAFDEEDRCVSAKAWREILGENDDGWVFDMPEGCEDDGKAAAFVPIRSGRSQVPAGDRHFA
jgi:hypothetical protein